MSIRCRSLPTTTTLANVRAILEERAVGLGVPIREIRRRYPAKQVRRASIQACVQHFEDLGLVRVHHGRVRWEGPIRPEARPLALPLRRLARDAALTPQERVALMADLSDALARERA